MSTQMIRFTFCITFIVALSIVFTPSVSAEIEIQPNGVTWEIEIQPNGVTREIEIQPTGVS